MKKLFKGVVAAVMMFCSSAVFAKSFDWSKCWCNYGAGIKAGTFIVDASVGINDTFFYFADNAGIFKQLGTGSWVLPYFDATLDVALPIWKLPLSWGGYCGFNASGANSSILSAGGFYFSFGGQVKYHVMLPPEKLDVYAGVRLGATIGADRVKITAPIGGFIGNINYDQVNTSPAGFYFGGFIGAAYYVMSGFGFTVEFGAPVWVKAGISIKIN